MHDFTEQPEDQESSALQNVNVDEPNGTESASSAMDAESLGRDPSNEEVVASIDVLRPETSFLAAGDISYLGNVLSNRYNTKQLSMYLQHVLKIPSFESHPQPPRASTRKSSSGIQRSLWQAGRTDISKRLGHTREARRTSRGRSKKSIVQRILRLAWNLRSTEETHSIGELELSLPNWQFLYLVSPSEDGTPLHQYLIDTPFLRRTADIQPYPPKKVIRITARQGDAEEVADQIQRNLSRMVSLQTDMAQFQELFGKDILEDELRKILSPSVCTDVGRRTSTIVDFNGTRVSIYGKTDHDVQTAKRVLLSLLPLPSPGTVESREPTLLDALEHPSERLSKMMLSFEHDDSELSFRDKSLKLGRLVLPKAIAATSVGSNNSHTNQSVAECTDSRGRISRSAEKLALYLSRQQLKLAVDVASENTPEPWEQSLVTTFAPSPWRIELGSIVRTGAIEDASSSQDANEVSPQRAVDRANIPANSLDPLFLHSCIPNMTGLLSYYTPATRTHSQESPSYRALVAHFMPSPFTRDGVRPLYTLPRIEVRYDPGKRDPLRSVVATLTRQSVRVPLPDEAVDLCFVRDIFISADPVNNLTDSLQQFTETLLQSPGRGLQSLQSEAEVSMKLPASWLADGKGGKRMAKEGLVNVPYQFDRFEVKEISSFAPPPAVDDLDWVQDESMKHLLQDKAVRLRYSEINGGMLGGSRRELRISCDPDPSSTDQMEGKLKTAPSQDLRLLVNTGFRIARAFTRLASGELKPAWEYDARRKRPRVRPQDAFDRATME